MLLSKPILEYENLASVEKTNSNQAMSFLVLVFFASISQEFNLFSINHTVLLVTALTGSNFSTTVGYYAGNLFAGGNHKQSLAAGFVLNAHRILRSVVLNIAFKAVIIEDVFLTPLIIIPPTTLTTLMMLKWVCYFMKKLVLLLSGKTL
jgi:Kef-type K+ transport system membrane component KefB